MQDKNMENSINLAKYMQKYICAATGRADKGVHQDNLAVLRLSSMPACLLELGFISTPDEEQYLNTNAAVERFARGFYNAFVAYKNKVSPSTKVPYNPAEEVKPVAVRSAVPAVKSSSEPQPVQNEEQSADPIDTTELAKQETPDTAATVPSVPSAASAPVFKVQLLACTTELKAGSPQLKGVADTGYYKENGMYKYTTGASTDYQAIYRLRKTLLDRFPQAFIIAFKDDVKVDVNEAIREYKANKK